MFAHQKNHVSIISVFNKFRAFLNASHAVVISALLFFTTIVQAGQVSLAWDPNTQSMLGGYKLFYGTASGNYSINVDVGKQTSYTVANLQDGAKYYFAVKAYDTTRIVESGFSNEASTTIIATTPPPSTALPTPWINMDIGNVGLVGSASYANSAFTVKGSGDDIWNTADAFRFVYQPLSGDGSIVARVTSITNTDSWAKAGVMIRESLDANARHAMVAVTAGNGVAFQRRTATGGSSAHTAGATLIAPYWVKLARSGNTFTAYQSVDGASWAQIGSVTLSMATSVYVGLAVTSHNNSTLNTSVLDNVSVQTASSSPSVVAPIANFSASPSSGTAPLTVTFADTSTGSIDSRAWIFSDGTTDTAQTVMKTFNTPGDYTVTLTVSNSAGSNTKSTNLSVTAPLLPTANFSASPTSGTAPLTVRFSDTSSGTVTAWSWDFGDGTSSTEQNPSHIFKSAGTYTIKLTATNSTGSNTKTQSGYITVSSSISTGGTTTMGGGTTSGSATSGGSTTSAFQQDSVAPNLLVMEAEHFTGNTAQGGYAWQATTSYGNYSDASALRALPEDNTRIDTNYAATSPRLDYQVNFVKTGTHYVWIRALGPSWSSDSLHVGLDGQEVASAARLSQLNPLGSWAWSRTTYDGTVATLNVTSTGVHTINVWMRESGTLLDKLVLTPDANYNPSDLGPDETINLESLESSPVNPSTGLVAAYNLNEGSGTAVVDASGNGNNGIISGATWTSSGKFGNTLSFNGVDNRVSLGRKLDFVAPFTAEAWIYPTSYADWCVILSKRDSFSPADMRFDIGLYTGTGALFVQDGTLHVSSYVPSLNTWTHVAVTIDANSSISLYVNGLFYQTLGTLSPGSDSTAEVMIGNTGDLDDPFQGMIDEVRIYNRALSASEIQSDMNTELQ